MNKEEIFQIWAPENATWSRWVKPVLFAHLDSALSHLPVTEVAGDVSWSPRPDEKVAIVLDLPGSEGVLAGVALALRGYRPVALYNAVPMPFGRYLFSPQTGQPVAAVNIVPILGAIRQGAEKLAQLSLPDDAPPAFLLDANRFATGRKMQPGEFDNGSVSFTTDFPSANFLTAQGIQRVLLVQKYRDEPQSDLVHSLCRWQDAGFVLEKVRIDHEEQPKRFGVARPSWYGAMFQRALSAVGLRRARPGGFGAWIPDSSSGG